MPHFCHIMTNNILPEILFSITTRHTFLFLSYFIYNKKFTRMKNTQSLKNIPWKKCQGLYSAKASWARKTRLPLNGFPSAVQGSTRILIDSLPYPHFHSPSMRQNEGLRKRLVRAYSCKGKPEKSGFCRAMFPPQKRAMGKNAQARLKKGLLSLAAVFQILDNAHIRKACPAREKLSPPFSGI